MSDEQSGRKGRIAEFKNMGKTMEHVRNKRREYQVSLRKDRREKDLEKKRHMDEDEGAGAAGGEDMGEIPDLMVGGKTLMERLTEAESNGTGVNFYEFNIADLAQMIMNDEDPAMQYGALVHLRRRLTRTAKPPVAETLTVPGLLGKIVQLLTWESHEYQYEAAWILTNISSGTEDQTAAVAEAGAAPYLAQLMYSPHANVKEQSAWALGNLAGDGAHLRDNLLQFGILDSFLELADPNAGLKFLRQAVWAIQNFFRWKNPPCPLEYMQRALPVLQPLTGSQDEDIASNATWAVCYISDVCDAAYDYILEHFGARLVENIKGKFTNSQLPSLRVLGTIMSGSHEQTDRVLGLRVLDCFRKLLKSEKPNIRKDAAWAISNVAAGTPMQINQIINANLVPDLIVVASGDDVHRVRQEATWALCNIVNAGNRQQVDYLIHQEVLPVFLNMVGPELQPGILVAILEAIFALLSNSNTEEGNFLADILEEMGADEKIEQLCGSENEDVSSIAQRITDTFFSREVMEVAGLAPQVAGQRFEFNHQPAHPQLGPKGGFQF